MTKKNAIARLLKRAAEMLNGAQVAELRLSTTSGTELVVETDADDPKVGDKATPDGEHRLEDGRVITVVDGVITEIKEKEVTEEEVTEEEVSAMLSTIETLTAKVEQLTANQKTDEEVAILDTVAKAGGMEWLRKVAVSKRVATQRTQTQSAQATGLSRIAQELETMKKNKNNK